VHTDAGAASPTVPKAGDSTLKTIGLIGGMSWESTAVYYRLLNEMAREALGGLHSAELVLWSFDFAAIETLQDRADWAAAAARMIEAARAVEAGGAQCVVICTNTMHRVADEVQAAVRIPLIHIADATARAVIAARVRRPLLLATRYTMEQDFYIGRLRGRHRIAVHVPDEEDRFAMHRIIYDELCRGLVLPASRTRCREIVDGARAAGADGVILGCTEVGMLLSQADFDIPVFDSTALHARAAMAFALDEQ
jgi:aspartate racemase